MNTEETQGDRLAISRKASFYTIKPFIPFVRELVVSSDYQQAVDTLFQDLEGVGYEERHGKVSVTHLDSVLAFLIALHEQGECEKGDMLSDHTLDACIRYRMQAWFTRMCKRDSDLAAYTEGKVPKGFLAPAILARVEELVDLGERQGWPQLLRVCDLPDLVCDPQE